jgi:osmotically-inducible protein OsmY
MSTFRIPGLVAVLALSGACSNESNKHAPDNTGHNADPAVITNGDHAAQSGSDLELTQRVRKTIIADSALSTNAHNCKIVVANGVVTLLGPVSDDVEKARVVDLAKQAGATQVVDQLEVSKSAAKPVTP